MIAHSVSKHLFKSTETVMPVFSLCVCILVPSRQNRVLKKSKDETRIPKCCFHVPFCYMLYICLFYNMVYMVYMVYMVCLVGRSVGQLVIAGRVCSHLQSGNSHVGVEEGSQR